MENAITIVTAARSGPYEHILFLTGIFCLMCITLLSISRTRREIRRLAYLCRQNKGKGYE